MIVPVLRMRVCAFVYIVTVCCSEHEQGWLTAYHVVSDVGFPPDPQSIVRVTLDSESLIWWGNVHA